MATSPPSGITNTRFSALVPTANSDGTVNPNDFNQFCRSVGTWCAEVDRLITTSTFDPSALEAEIAALQLAIDAIDVSGLPALQAQVDALALDVDGISTALDALAIQQGDDVTDLQDQIDTLAADVAAIDVSNYVPSTRTITTTSPLRISSGAGTASSNTLAADRTLSILAATTTAQGSVELATNAETITGTDTTRATTASGVAAAIAAAGPAWANWLPNLNGGWSTSAAPFLHGRYLVVGTSVFFFIEFGLTSGDSISGAPFLDLPFNVHSDFVGERMCVTTDYVDNVGTQAQGRAQLASSAGVGYVYPLVSSTSGTFLVDAIPGVNIPFPSGALRKVAIFGHYIRA